MIVAKFGGSSMGDADSIRLVANILKQDDSRRVAVVSAPGRSERYSEKVTDLLYANKVALVGQRFFEIMTNLGLDTAPLPGMLRWVSRATEKKRVAFGEYMSAYILAKFLGWKFVDARHVFTLTGDGHCPYDSVFRRCRLEMRGDTKVVLPGFYGASCTGGIELFPRGGSDISGALVAEGVGAKLYENWTDVSGVYTADPRVYPSAKHLSVLTYREAEMLSLGGATVFHREALGPVANRCIPVHVRNTFAPTDPGTFIVADKRKYLDPSV